MALIRIRQLTFRNFLSYLGETTIDFPDSGLVLIRGYNLDSGGSSGSGKSSILLAIQYALGICHLPATSLQSWLTEAPMGVELVLSVDDTEVTIARGRGTPVSVQVAGERVSGVEAEGRLERLLGLPSNLLEALTYRKQRNRGQFLSKRDAEKKEFLAALLGLGCYEEVVEGALKNISDLEPKLAVYEDSKDLLDSELSSFVARPIVEVVSEEKAQKELRDAEDKVAETQKLLSEQKVAIKSLESTIEQETKRIAESYLPIIKSKQEELSNALQNKIAEPDRTEEEEVRRQLNVVKEHLREAREKDRQNLAVEQEHARSLQQQLDRIRNAIQARERAQARGGQLLTELESLEQNVCPTCKQQWLQAQERKTEIECELEKLATQVVELEDCNDDKVRVLQADIEQAYLHVPHPDIGKWQEKVGELSPRLAALQQKNDAQKSLLRAEHDSWIAQLRASIESIKARALEEANHYKGMATERLEPLYEKCDSYESELRTARALLDGCRSELYQTNLRNLEIKKQLEADARREGDLRLRLMAAQKQVDETAAALAAERDLVDLIGRGGFLGAIFDEVLWEIAEETNKILASIPNTAHLACSLRSEWVTQKGKTKKSITPVITVGGHETSIEAGCSGGMASSIELAVDLAVAAVVSRRTGASPAWLILDEAFEGLGPVEKEGVFAILQQYSQGKLILVVDHASETKELFTNHLTVEYQDGVSRIVGSAMK
jgi:DNA repair exonuclease SbcCD ATPase subunit